MTQSTDINLICRVCLCEHNDMKSISDVENFGDNKLKIKTVIATCAPIQARIEAPKICPTCLENLRKAFAFKNLCYWSDYKLRNGSEMLFLQFDDVFNDKCRVCLNDNHDVKSIFEVEDFSGVPMEIITVIKKCAHIWIDANDLLPKLICLKCLGDLHDAYAFKKLCEDCKSRLHNAPEEIKEVDDDREICSEDGFGEPEDLKEVQVKTEIFSEDETEEIKEVEVKTEICSEDYFGETKVLSEDVLKDVFVKKEPELNEETYSEMLSFVEVKCETLPLKNESDENVEDPLTVNTNNNQITKLSSIKNPKKKEPSKFFECFLCSKRFSLKQYLRQHIKWHSGEKPFECDTCDVKCTTAGSLKVHKRLHTGERPYKCAICSKNFISSTDLSKHKFVHMDTKPACEICGREFKDMHQLRAHSESHEMRDPQRCDVCFKLFIRPSTLRRHKRSHTWVKAFKCDVCDKRFVRHQNLCVHKRGHDVQKPIEELSV